MAIMQDLFIELDAILAVSLGGNSLDGGRFSLIGSLIGALIIQSITTTIYALGVPPEITLVVKAIVVIIICLLQSAKFREIVFSKRAQKRGKPHKAVAITIRHAMPPLECLTRMVHPLSGKYNYWRICRLRRTRRGIPLQPSVSLLGPGVV